MQDKELTSFILERSGKSFNHDEIITELCENTGLTWGEAEALVVQVQAENQATIARHQFPLMFFVALVIFTTGLLLTGYGIYGIFLNFSPQGSMPDDLTTYFMPIIETGLDPFHALLLAISAYFKLILYFLISPISLTFLGIAMLIGSLVGMRKTWSAILGYG
jgi:hypothetical protein